MTRLQPVRAYWRVLPDRTATKPHQELLAAYQIDQINREIADDLAREIEREFRQEQR